MSKFPVSGGGIPGLGSGLVTDVDGAIKFDVFSQQFGNWWGDFFVSGMGLHLTPDTNPVRIGRPLHMMEAAGKIWMMGYTGANNSYKLYSYDPATEIWVGGYSDPDVAIGQSYPNITTAFGVGNDIYLLEQQGGSLVFRKYATETNTWSALNVPSTPTNIGAAVFAYIGNHNGYADFIVVAQVGLVSGFPNTMRYNLAGNSWSDLGVTAAGFLSATSFQTGSLTDTTFATHLRCRHRFFSVKNGSNFLIDVLQSDIAQDGTGNNTLYQFNPTTPGYSVFAELPLEAFTIRQLGYAPQRAYHIVGDWLFMVNLYRPTSGISGGINAFNLVTGRHVFIPARIGAALGDCHVAVISDIMYVMDYGSGIKINLGGIESLLDNTKTIIFDTSALA